MPLPFADALDALAALPEASLESVQIASAALIAGQAYPQIDPGQPLLLTGLDAPATGQALLRTLAKAYPAGHEVSLIRDGALQRLPLSNVPALPAGEPGCLFVPPLPEPTAYVDLQEVVARLRAPDGCPWDRELTWHKLRSSLLEESYELLDALDAGVPAKVAEELGDLLLQIALITEIAVEEDRFRAADVISGIVAKLIRRHPHVFGDAVVSGTDEVLANWEAIKRAERAENEEQRSPLASIPSGLPALAQAQAYQERIARVQEVPVPHKPWSGLAELPPGAAVSADILGQALFGLVSWARAHGLDAESALRATNAHYASEIARQEIHE